MYTEKELKEDQIWEDDKIDALKKIILAESKKQTPERKLRNELLGIRYQMEDYIAQDQEMQEKQPLDFVKMYLKALGMTQRQLAAAFEMKAANLYKYLTGERRLNADLVLKLSSFSHTQPELWYHIQTKNELIELRKEKEKIKQYEKYDYENFISAVAEPPMKYASKKKPKEDK